ncbi:MAG: aldolase catalytic domain-containing protein [Proteobacteria bacterium]|nr:aldolase catalytic domain-containing protein [Pseudomonadota bacterium]
MINPVILDCSLRDGGYYNGWDFPPPLVKEYLATMASIPVDVIEIGFRSFADGTFKGAHFFSTDDYLRTLPLPSAVTIAVMVNAKTLLAHESGPVKAVDELFTPSTRSPVGLVRIAAHLDEASRCGSAVERLHELGYRVGFNLMQAGLQSPDAITERARQMSNWPVEVIYFADSIGNMDASSVGVVCEALRRGWSGDIGIHTHDSMCNALSNSMAAIAAGVRWVDGTVLGIGRGPGNVRLEYLLMEVNRVLGRQYPLTRLLELLSNRFLAYQRICGWGPHPLYFLSAQHGIHPTYVQEMMADPRYSEGDILEALRYLSKEMRHNYRPGFVESAFLSANEGGNGSWIADGWAGGRDVLLIAPGIGVDHHLEALNRFIDSKQPLTIALNVSASINPERLTAYLSCHPHRILMDAQRFLTLARPLIAPLDRLPESARGPLAERGALDYGMSVRPNVFSFEASCCTLPRPLAAAYALAVATRAGARRILLAGFDGFANDDPRQVEMVEVLRLYQSTLGTCPLLAITPTSYAVPQSSVYAPDP